MDSKTNPILLVVKMRRLQQLLQSQTVFIDDVLYFSFKKHTFTGKVAKGGLIWKCTWQKPGEEVKPVFSNSSTIEQQRYVRTFESLTDWTETCIQECLDEYHTRYSSWKRVRHQRTDQPMEVLFKHLQKKQLTKESNSSKNILLYEQIAALTHHVESLKSSLENWKVWFEQNHTQSELPVDTVSYETPAPQQSSSPDVQPFILTSDKGQYMVLHRMNEVAPPECISWLKENGPASFKQILGQLPETIQFEPPSPSVTDFRSGLPNADISKHFVHNFFL